MSKPKPKAKATAEALAPGLILLCKLASVVQHADEMLSPGGRVLDQHVLKGLLEDPEVQQWIKDMGPYVPVKR